MKACTLKFAVLLVFLLLLTEALSSCRDKKNYDASCCMVKYMAPPDNCDDWMIVIVEEDPVNNVYYKPDHLPDEFKVDDSQVTITYSMTGKKHDCGFGGYVPIIKIEKIEKCK